MKKNLLCGLALSLLVFQTQAGTVQTCGCANRCSSGTVCNCATNSCAAKRTSPYAYGYIDTRTPTYTNSPAYAVPPYQAPAMYGYTGQPSRKFASYGAEPYFAARFMLSKAIGDFEHTQMAGADYASYKGDIDDGTFGGALAFGVRVNNFRFELEGNLHSKAKADYAHVPLTTGEFQDEISQEIQAMGLLLNAYVDFDLGMSFKPYIGGGLGVGRLKSKLTSVDPNPAAHRLEVYNQDTNKTNFIWQLGAGFSYPVQDNINLEAGYRYTYYGKVPVNDWRGMMEAGTPGRDNMDVKDYHTHTLSLGMRFDI